MKREGRESKCRDRPEKLSCSAGGGGGGGGAPTHFFQNFYGVGAVRLPDRPPRWGKKIGRKRGGGAAADSAPPPLDPPLDTDSM